MNRLVMDTQAETLASKRAERLNVKWRRQMEMEEDREVDRISFVVLLRYLRVSEALVALV